MSVPSRSKIIRAVCTKTDLLKKAERRAHEAGRRRDELYGDTVSHRHVQSRVMKFAEFQPGMILNAGRRRVSEEEILDFARRYDPQWFHTDPQRAAASRWQGLISSGWLTCSIAMQLLATHVLADSESIGSPGLEQVKWPNPLRPGDEVELVVEVLQTRVSSSGKIGIVRWRWILTTLAGVQVLDIIGTSLFELAPAG
jgi:acyl dehydratase